VPPCRGPIRPRFHPPQPVYPKRPPHPPPTTGERIARSRSGTPKADAHKPKTAAESEERHIRRRPNWTIERRHHKPVLPPSPRPSILGTRPVVIWSPAPRLIGNQVHPPIGLHTSYPRYMEPIPGARSKPRRTIVGHILPVTRLASRSLRSPCRTPLCDCAHRLLLIRSRGGVPLIQSSRGGASPIRVYASDRLLFDS